MTEAIRYRLDLGDRWYLVTRDPAGWPDPHSPTNDHVRGDCPGLPVWRVARTDSKGELWGHNGYYCDADLPAEFRACAWCRTPITGRRQKRYCSNRCTVAAYRSRNHVFPEITDRTCEWCFSPLPVLCRPTQLYCDAACKQAAWRAGCSAGETREDRAEKWARVSAKIAEDRERITISRNT